MQLDNTSASTSKRCYKFSHKRRKKRRVCFILTIFSNMEIIYVEGVAPCHKAEKQNQTLRELKTTGGTVKGRLGPCLVSLKPLFSFSRVLYFI